MTDGFKILSVTGLLTLTLGGLLLFFKNFRVDPNKYIEIIDTKNCGSPVFKPDISLNNHNSKIIGGKHVIPHSFPWIVSLRELYINQNGTPVLSDHFCGGSLIAQQYVLTAAHCVAKPITPNNLKIVVGLDSSMAFSASDIYDVSKYVVHQQYDDTFYFNDIVLIKLQKPVKLSENVSTICLPSLEKDQSDLIINKTAYTAGWGSLNGEMYGGDFPDLLQQAVLKVEDNIFCVEQRDYFYPNMMYCAFDEQSKNGSNTNVCYGDSGGPLMEQIDEKWYLFGVTSTVAINESLACDPTKPSDFTSIPYFIDWIKQNIVKLNQSS